MIHILIKHDLDSLSPSNPVFLAILNLLFNYGLYQTYQIKKSIENNVTINDLPRTQPGLKTYCE